MKDFDRPLQLWLFGNSLECDNKLCWLKIEVERGNIFWRTDSGSIQKPSCIGGKTWDQVEWDCPEESKFIMFVACIFKKNVCEIRRISSQ